MRVLIFANGRLEAAEIEHIQIHEDDRVIGADGGARHCLALGIRPNLVVGDFDSLTPDELHRLESDGVALERHPAAKDETDLELALAAADRWGGNPILIYGALGARWDMSVANLLLLAHEGFQGLDIRLIAGRQTVRLARGGEQLRIEGQAGDLVSLIPLRGDALGVRTEGLEYPLNDETLRFGYTRGISNVLQGSRAQISLASGELLVIQGRSPKQEDQ